MALGAPTPTAQLSQTALWARAGLLFGGGTNIARDVLEWHRYTVVPLPAVPPSDLTIQARNDAVALSFQGRLEEAVDIYRGTVEGDGFMAGILRTMAEGIVGLTPDFQGDPAMVSALLDADGTPGDFGKMHPRAEVVKILSDGIGFGLGLGQYLLACWRCSSIDWDPITVGGRQFQFCQRCHAEQSERPFGQRESYQLRWRDLRWLSRIPIARQWYYSGVQGKIPITPGDGEWFLFQTSPDQDCWRHGPWVPASIAAIFARDATYDRQNTSAVCAPTRLFEAKGPTAPNTRSDVEQQAQGMKFGNAIILPGEWAYRIEAAKSDYVAVSKEIVDWGRNAFEVLINGHMQGLVGGPGFANVGEFSSTTRSRRTFFASTWIEQICSQGLPWWGIDNWGTRNVPVGKYDVRSPEEKLADSRALEAEGAALRSYRDGLDAHGMEIEPAWLVEREQKKGIRIKPKAASPSVSKLILGDEAVMACVRGGAALASLGLPPFGDERDGMTLTQLANLGAEGAKSAAAPTLPSAPSVSGAQSIPEARVVADADEEDEFDPDEDDAARFAAEMTAAGIECCPHGRKHSCPRCGIKRVYSVVSKPGEPPSFGLAWRPIGKAVAA